MTDTAPLYEGVAQAPKGGQAQWATTADGVRVRMAHWTGGQKGTVFIFPGRTEYIEKYGLAAGEFLDRGYSSVVIDWRGQGIADRALRNRMLGHVDEFAEYQLDLQAVMAKADALNLPKPYFMVAHSMGGCIGLRTLQGVHPFKAVAFSAPMWGIHLSSQPLRWFAWALTAIAPFIGLGGKMSPGTEEETYVIAGDFDGNTLTKDETMFAYMRTQATTHADLALGGPTLRWFGKALREMRTLSKTASPLIPAITHLGTDEKIVDPRRIHDRMDRWPNGTKTIVQNAEHEVMMEVPDARKAFYDDAVELFDAHL